MRKLPLALFFAVLLAACRGGPIIRIAPGEVATSRLAVRTDIAWTEIRDPTSWGWPKQRFWSVHGPLLDRLVLVADLAEGEQLQLTDFETRTREPAVPFRATASGAELAEFVLASLERQGFAGATLDSRRPVSFAGGEGIHAEFRLRDGRTGVAHRGLALARIVGFGSSRSSSWPPRITVARRSCRRSSGSTGRRGSSEAIRARRRGSPRRATR
ncbi:MAG: hypothetical protein KatS3mg117_0774 [Geminicoccaceae bacterium]|nr:MAG: hypothetical protein KatS3mg117_0774 [Geminicoccaceae bacterium]